MNFLVTLLSASITLLIRLRSFYPIAIKTLIDVCRTQWIVRIDGLDRVAEPLGPLLSTLEDVQLNMDNNGVVHAGT